MLATLGGQTALNIAVELAETGVLDRYGVRLIGADVEAIRRGEDRERFKEIVRTASAATCRAAGGLPTRWTRCSRPRTSSDLPVVLRPSFTMGGAGSGVARDPERLRRMAAAGLAASPVHEVLVEESVLGWKEFELELMRDRNDNVVVVCSIENVDPMGVHTGDSVTVAPAMTLTDREYQAHARPRASRCCARSGWTPAAATSSSRCTRATGRMVVIEMNPRVSRSSALASKATGFPIAKIAAKLAIGYTLDEIRNDITGETPAVVRADARLRRGQGAAVRVREVPDRRPGADHAHEERRRGDGDRPQLHRGAGQGDALDRDQPGRLLDRRRPGRRSGRPGPAGGRAGDPDRRPALHDRAGDAGRRHGRRGGRGQRHRPLVRRPDRDRAARSAATSPTRPCSPRPCCAGPSGSACPTGRSPRCGRSWPARTGCARCGRAAGSGRCSRPWTPARPSSPRPRRTTTRPTTRRPRSRRSRTGRR